MPILKKLMRVQKFYSLLYFASFVILSPHDCFVLLILVHCAMLSNWQLLLLILPGHHRSLQHSRAAHPHTCRARDVSDASSRRDVTSLTDRCCVHATAGVIVVAAAADSLIACQVNYCHLDHVFDSTHCCALLLNRPQRAGPCGSPIAASGSCRSGPWPAVSLSVPAR